MDLYYLHQFFDRLNSKNTKEYLVDTFTVVFNYPDRKEEKIMLLYLGIGCDAEVCTTLHAIRRYFPFLFKINKVTRLFYAFSHSYHWIPCLWRGTAEIKLFKT